MIAYDISDDRARIKVAKLLEKYIDRVQKSVFEGNMRDADIEVLKGLLAVMIDPQTDSIRIYKLCSECKKKTEVIGYKVVPSDRLRDEVI